MRLGDLAQGILDAEVDCADGAEGAVGRGARLARLGAAHDFAQGIVLRRALVKRSSGKFERTRDKAKEGFKLAFNGGFRELSWTCKIPIFSSPR